MRAVALACAAADGVWRDAVARAEEARVDLNAASAAELEALPGVGPSKARAIIAHREVAPFKTAEELVEVKGIGEKLYAQLKDRVTVSAAGSAGAARTGTGRGQRRLRLGRKGRSNGTGGGRAVACSRVATAPQSHGPPGWGGRVRTAEAGGTRPAEPSPRLERSPGLIRARAHAAPLLP